jgi:hypothetical protein
MEFSSSIKEIILKYISDNNYVFVFNTEVASDTWSQWVVKNDSLTKMHSIPLNRFLAWDEFKEKYINPKKEGKTAVSSIVRKLFSRNVIKQNALNQINKKDDYFKKIIRIKDEKTSYDEYLEETLTFTNWISKILSSLKLWHELHLKSSNFFDEEDSDLELLYTIYLNFLEKNNLYEQSWLDVNLFDEEKQFVIFYPEILEDYNDYQELFSKNKKIIEIKMPPLSNDEKIFVYKYPDSRSELHYTALNIRYLIENKKALWTDIAINVPDITTYKPYLQRELDLYNIPYKFRVGDSFVKNCAGRIFVELKNCSSSDFSFDSLRALLCDTCIPWKNIEDNNNLILQGNKLRCVCSYEKNETSNEIIDVWKSSLKSISVAENDYYDNLYKYYNKIVVAVKRICDAKTFTEIRDGWFIFKTEFLDENFDNNYSEFDKERYIFQNNILSSCIKELNSIIDVVENENSSRKINSLNCERPYDFFLDELKNKTYTPQTKTVGISIFSYKTSAMASFKYQFIIDSSQNSLSIPYNYISFLTTDKRKKLFENTERKMDRSATDIFIRLYAKPENNCFFSYAESSFGGYAISSTFLTEKEIENKDELLKIDFICEEKKLFFTETAKPENNSIAKEQISRFFEWKENNSLNKVNKSSNENLHSLIDKILIHDRNNSLEKINPELNKKSIKISQSDMKNFFPCKRKWIFTNIFKIRDESLDTNLITYFDMGNIFHSTLEMFMKSYQEKRIPLPVTNSKGIFENEDEITTSLNKIIKTVLLNSDCCKSKIVYDLLSSQIDKILKPVLSFLHRFCIEDSEPELNKNGSISIKSARTKGFGGYEVLSVEKKYCKDFATKDYTLFGIPDLVIANNEFSAIIDYKTNSTPTKDKIFPTEDFGILNDYQLPMYISLLKEKYKHFDNAGFYSIRKNDNPTFAIDKYSYSKNDDTEEIKQNKTEDDFKPVMDVFDNYLDVFYKNIIQLDFEPKSGKMSDFNNVDLYKDCKVCTYNNICRYTYSIASKKMNKDDKDE